ncbi:MAG: adenosylcobalamin-dependent ribonucleoside-diphosphate reductase [Rhodobacteraceae bacterium]|nr:adenosylcobalamin-dependent ribonucleoside-diphosphate reductase [Paracoccaceae bacterium]
MSRFPNPISQDIWDMKYRLKQADGTPIDQSVDDTWRRIARALASVENDQTLWEDRFYSALEDFRFLPAGRILAGAGTGRNVTLFNCYVMGTIPDSMGGIFEHLKEAALTMQQGGGIGYDFSTLRPKGAPVKGVAADASGPLSFMDCWDAMCRTVMSAGSRRGAMMATMRCDYPDIEAFIAAKADPARLRMFNVSVLVTDAFMDAVKTNGPWPLVFNGQVWRTIQAQDLWDRIMRATYDYAEPGVIFIDRINRDNNLRGIETIAATNPCGEEPLPPYGACLLGSVNLTRFVTNPFSDTAGIDTDALTRVVALAVRMMDNVNDVSNFPLSVQAEEATAKRRIGLGVTGLADTLAMLGLTYGTEEAAMRSRQLMKDITIHAYETSVALAREKGAFPAFEAEQFLAKGTFASRLPEPLRDGIARHGIRNSHLTSIAPTGTISLYAGNVSSGIEPIFATSYDRKVLQPDGSRVAQAVQDYALKVYHDRGGAPDELPATFVTAQSLPPRAHLDMQAAMQPWVDSAISKTINLPGDIPFDEFKDVYLYAWDAGCKGCTTYRPNDVTGSVLSVSAGKEKTDRSTQTAGCAARGTASAGDTAPDLLKRGPALEGRTYKLKWPESPHALYITINDTTEGGERRPFEVFINSRNMEHFAWTVALTRMISAVFRRGGDIAFVAEELKAVFDPRGGAWMGGTYTPSILAAIGGVIEGHMRNIGYVKDTKLAGVAPDAGTDATRPRSTPCPNCGSLTTQIESSCLTCLDCGYSKCT